MSDLDELIQQAQTLRARFEKIQIIGPGWSGNSREGFIFNPTGAIGESGEQTGGGGPPPPPPACTCCPSSDTITIAFSGIVLCATCVERCSGFWGTITSGDPNQVISLTSTPPGEGICSFYQNLATGISFTVDFYNDPGCTMFNRTVTAPLQVQAFCYNDGSTCRWFVVAFLDLSEIEAPCEFDLFYTDTPVDVSQPNLCNCSIIPGVALCVTTGGTAAIT